MLHKKFFKLFNFCRKLEMIQLKRNVLSLRNPLIIKNRYCDKKWHSFINPLSPNIHIQILQTDLYTFPSLMG